MFDRASGKILSGNKAPSAANIDKWLKEHPTYEVVRSTSKTAPNTKVSAVLMLITIFKCAFIIFKYSLLQSAILAYYNATVNILSGVCHYIHNSTLVAICVQQVISVLIV